MALIGIARSVATGLFGAATALAALTVFASGCQHSVAAMPAHLEPAPSAACLAEMTEFASRQTGRQVTLTTGAFGNNHTLLLEPPLLRGPDGRPLDGRNRGLPEAFVLLTHEGRCDMIHERTAARHVLRACACRAAH